MMNKNRKLKLVLLEAQTIAGLAYSFEGRERLQALFNSAMRLCHETGVPGKYKRPKELETHELRLLLELRHLLEQYGRGAGNYGQHYTEDLQLCAGDVVPPLGFHKAYNRDGNRAIAKRLNLLTVFPHYGISFYDLKSGAPIEKGPEVFQMPDCYNFGKDSFFTLWDAFMLFMGWPDSILYDMELMIQSAEKVRTLWAGNDMLGDLDSLCYKISGDSSRLDYYEQLEGMRRVYLELEAQNRHSIDRLKNFNYLVSIVISRQAREKIRKSADGFLTPMCQVPFGLGGYRHILEQQYGYRENKAATLSLLDRGYPMFAIRSHLYGHPSRVICDGVTGVVTGKMAGLKRFLLELKQRNLLAEKDLVYLTAF